jgi:eukaryotic-like serine/threonine-protein kinase
MYAHCVAAGSCTEPYDTKSYHGPNHYGNSQYADFPVVDVDWYQASAYCSWAGRRLPTEAEWKKAARGTDGRIFPWGNQELRTLANYNQNVGDATKVGSYPAGASPYGAFDMAGNVWEWVADWYSATYYQSSPSRNPTGPSLGQWRGLRGGSYMDDIRRLRSAGRRWLPPDYWEFMFGFRCAVSS